MAAKSTEPLRYNALPKKLGSATKERHKLLDGRTDGNRRKLEETEADEVQVEVALGIVVEAPELLARQRKRRSEKVEECEECQYQVDYKSAKACVLLWFDCFLTWRCEGGLKHSILWMVANSSHSRGNHHCYAKR